MIPPVDRSILESNPQYASLHRHLTTNLLNPDASTRAISEAPVSISGALRSRLLQALKDALLRSSLRNIAARGEGIEEKDVPKPSPGLSELLGTISMLLDEALTTRLGEEDYELLAPDIDAFHDNVEQVAGAVSKDLQRQCELLCKIASIPNHPQRDLVSTTKAANSKRPYQNSAYTPSQSPDSLPALLRPLLPVIADPILQSSLVTLTDTALQHASVHRTLLSTTLTHLERTIHGLYARHTKARSAHLSAVATALAKRIEVVYLQSRNRVYRTDVQRALENYHQHLQAVKRAMDEREGTLRAVLEEFDDVSFGRDSSDGGQGRKGTMSEVGRRYGEVLRQIAVVKEDIEKLQSGSDKGQQSGI